MMDALKSLNKVLSERLVSPLFGSFILSWSVWNWKLIFIIFSSEPQKGYEAKLKYISENLNDWQYLYLYPVISTLIILLFFPYLSLGAYWLWLKTNILKKKIKNKEEKNELITLEESVELKLKIQNVNEEFNSVLNQKDSEIENLNKEIAILQNKIKTEKPVRKSNKEKAGTQYGPATKTNQDLYEKIKKNKKLWESMIKIFDAYKNKLSSYEAEQLIDQDSIEFFKINYIFNFDYDDIVLKHNGETIYKKYLNENILEKDNSTDA